MAEDFNKLRLMTKKLVKTPFQKGWQFRVEIEGQPADFQLFVKEITYGPTEIETEPIKTGAITLTFPNATAPVGISMTMRDHVDRRIYNWLQAFAQTVVNTDGTVNVPNAYLKNFTRYTLHEDGSEKQTDKWQVYPTQMGDITESVDEPGFIEFPITLIQFRS